MKPLIAKMLYKPYLTLLLCLLFLSVNLVLDRTLFRAFLLNRNLRVVKNRIQHLQDKNQDIEDKIKKATDPEFIEKEARQRLDYANEGDLIFIFPENF